VDGNSFRTGTVQIERALFSTRQASFFFAELTAIALLVGLVKQSWYWGGGTMALLTVGLAFRPLRLLLVLSLSGLWGALGYFIAYMATNEVPAGVVCSIAVFLLALFCHRAALDWISDYTGGSAAPSIPLSLPDDRPRQQRECPHCAEEILVRANVCKHCGRDVAPLDDADYSRDVHPTWSARTKSRRAFSAENRVGTGSDTLLEARTVGGVIAVVVVIGLAYWKLNGASDGQHAPISTAEIARPAETPPPPPSMQSAPTAVVSESGPPPFPFAVYVGKVANGATPNISATLTLYFNFVADSLSGRADIGPELAGGGVFSARATTDSLFLISTSAPGDTIRWAAGHDADGHYSGSYTVTGGRSSGQGGIWEVEHSSGADLQFVPRKND
jgi:hypothetical protein